MEFVPFTWREAQLGTHYASNLLIASISFLPSVDVWKLHILKVETSKISSVNS